MTSTDLVLLPAFLTTVSYSYACPLAGVAISWRDKAGSGGLALRSSEVWVPRHPGAAG
jgi:hypothetical protein